MSGGGDRSAIKSDAQVISHRLNSLVITTFEPWKDRVTGKIIHPALERSRNFDPQLRGLMENRRAGVGGENIRPEFRAGEFLADVHHKAYGLAALFWSFTGKPENNIERRNHPGLYAALGGLIDVAKNLKIFIHQLHHSRRGGFDSLADLMKPRATQ